jgi:uncharacterized integral membrane protein
MNILVYFLVCLFFVALFVVGIYNTEDVVVNLIVWRAGPAPLGAVMATASILGIAFACAIGILDGIKIRIANRTLRRQLQRLDEECDALRLQLARHQGRSASESESEKEKARSF